jgi:predicted RNA binding protein YcfA (HicA-like mRNA interferase family)
MWDAPSHGSHRQDKHPTKPGRVTVAGNDGDEIKPGTLYAVVIEGE